MGAIDVDVHVSDIAAALTSFNVIRIRRSTAGPADPYTELTAAAADAATMLGTNPSAFTIVGLTLQLLRDSQPQLDVTFTGTNPLTSAQVAAQINTAASVTIAANDSGRVRLTSTLTGTQSKLQIVGGSAAAVLGFTTGQRVIGHDAYVPLVSGQSSYTYVDEDGVAGYYYEAAFFHTTTLLMSVWSAPFQGGAGVRLSAGALSTATVDLVDASGKAVVGQKISFFPSHKPLQSEGFQVALNRSPIEIATDNAGHAEISLVRGLSVRVVFHGTNIIRDITIPNAASFDLLTLIQGAPDIFDVVKPTLPAAPRRALVP